MKTQKMWQEWMCDTNWLDYGGTWMRHVSGRRYHFVSLLNWADTCGERDAREVGSTYCVDLAEVDLDEIGDFEVADAVKNAGIEYSQLTDMEKAGCCHDYGRKAPLSSVNGNNAHKLLRDAKRESRALDDPQKHSTALEKPVNRLGSTAAEFMVGDIYSAVLRGVAEDKPEALLCLKMGVR